MLWCFPLCLICFNLYRRFAKQQSKLPLDHVAVDEYGLVVRACLLTYRKLISAAHRALHALFVWGAMQSRPEVETKEHCRDDTASQ